MDDLAVIDVELKFQVRNLQFPDEIIGETEIVEEVAGHVAWVDRLDHDIEPVRRKELGGIGDRLVECFRRLAVRALGNPRHQVQPLDAGRLRVRQRGDEALFEIVEAVGQRGKALLAGSRSCRAAG